MTIKHPRTPGFHVGDTVRITAEDLDGQQGELRVIDPEAGEGEFFGVYLEKLRVIDPEAGEGEFFGVYLENTQSIQFFCADEIEKVGN